MKQVAPGRPLIKLPYPQSRRQLQLLILWKVLTVATLAQILQLMWRSTATTKRQQKTLSARMMLTKRDSSIKSNYPEQKRVDWKYQRRHEGWKAQGQRYGAWLSPCWPGYFPQYFLTQIRRKYHLINLIDCISKKNYCRTAFKSVKIASKEIGKFTHHSLHLVANPNPIAPPPPHENHSPVYLEPENETLKT